MAVASEAPGALSVIGPERMPKEEEVMIYHDPIDSLVAREIVRV